GRLADCSRSYKRSSTTEMIRRGARRGGRRRFTETPYNSRSLARSFSWILSNPPLLKTTTPSFGRSGGMICASISWGWGGALLGIFPRPAVAENHYHVVWPEQRNDSVHNRVGIFLVERR